METVPIAGSFTCGCLNMLASGSLYVFALYAPSFTGHLGYSQTQTSLIAVIGDIGLYGVGPVSGLMADRLGPRPPRLWLPSCSVSVTVFSLQDIVEDWKLRTRSTTHPFPLHGLFPLLAGMEAVPVI